MSNISRQAYADMFGPTVGDKVRLADTELWIEVEGDLTTYGEEGKFGGGLRPALLLVSERGTLPKVVLQQTIL